MSQLVVEKILWKVRKVMSIIIIGKKSCSPIARCVLGDVADVISHIDLRMIMPALGNQEFPKANIESIIEAAKKIANQFKGQPFDRVALSTALGYKGPRTGGFNQVLADLRRFGVIDGRGDAIQATSIAQRLAVPSGPDEYSMAVLEMMNKVPLFAQLYDHYEGTVPSAEDLQTTLINLTKDNRVTVAGLVPLIRGNLAAGWSKAGPYRSSKSPGRPIEQTTAGSSESNLRESDRRVVAREPNSVDSPVIELFAGNIRLQYPFTEDGVRLMKEHFSSDLTWKTLEGEARMAARRSLIQVDSKSPMSSGAK